MYINYKKNSQCIYKCIYIINSNINYKIYCVYNHT